MPTQPGYSALRYGRVSIAGRTYFLTVCTASRKAGLATKRTATAIRNELSALDVERVIDLRAAVVMSDHIHVLLRIRGSHSIGQIVGRLKSKTRKVLAEVELTWQPSYFERQLRQGDLVGDVLRYIYLNPYREGLIRTDKIYDHFWLGSEDSAWFRPTTDDDHPFPQWLM